MLFNDPVFKLISLFLCFHSCHFWKSCSVNPINVTTPDEEYEGMSWMNDPVWISIFGHSFLPFLKGSLDDTNQSINSTKKVPRCVTDQYVRVQPCQSWGCRVKWDKIRPKIFWRFLADSSDFSLKELQDVIEKWQKLDYLLYRISSMQIDGMVTFLFLFLLLLLQGGFLIQLTHTWLWVGLWVRVRIGVRIGIGWWKFTTFLPLLNYFTRISRQQL